MPPLMDGRFDFVKWQRLAVDVASDSKRRDDFVRSLDQGDLLGALETETRSGNFHLSPEDVEVVTALMLDPGVKSVLLSTLAATFRAGNTPVIAGAQAGFDAEITGQFGSVTVRLQIPLPADRPNH